MGRTKNKPEESNALVKGGHPKKSCKESDKNGSTEKQIIDVRSEEPELEYFAENQGSEISVPSARENSSKSGKKSSLFYKMGNPNVKCHHSLKRHDVDSLLLKGWVYFPIDRTS